MTLDGDNTTNREYFNYQPNQQQTSSSNNNRPNDGGSSSSTGGFNPMEFD